MSIGLFKKAQRAPSPSESIQKLRNTLEMLEKREKYLEQKIVQELQNAKKLAGKNKRLAMMSLKRKKMYENQTERLSGARMTIEQQIIAIENASVNFETLDAMRAWRASMQSLNRNMDIDDVEDTIEDIREQMDVANEIGDAIARPIGMDLDDTELEAELNQLAEQELTDQFKELEVPNTEPVKRQQPAEKEIAKTKPQTEDDAEFEALAADMLN